jgi:hypothetical protein
LISHHKQRSITARESDPQKGGTREVHFLRTTKGGFPPISRSLSLSLSLFGVETTQNLPLPRFGKKSVL